MTFNLPEFQSETKEKVKELWADESAISASKDFLKFSDRHNYGYFWSWLGLPIIQMPEDIVLTQEIIWETKPDLIVEAGVAWGGSLALYSSLQQIIGKGITVGIDVTIPDHNYERIMSLPTAQRIRLIRGSSTDQSIFDSIASLPEASGNVLVILDSNHSHNHVLDELNLWTALLKKNNYVVVSDTFVERIPKQEHRKRMWGPGDNPGTAVASFLNGRTDFTDQNRFSERAFVSFNPGGYLLKI